MSAKILIVGAGPSGLVSALTLNKLNIPFKIIDKEKDLSTESRAMAVMPGTLEHYSQLGIADAVINEAINPDEIHFHTSNKTTTFDFDKINLTNARFNHPYTYPQDEHETLLYETLKNRGGEVQWETEFVDSITQESKVQVKLKQGPNERIETFDYVIGADGGSSQVRKALNIEFPGETNEELFYVSDVEIKEEAFQKNDAHAFLKDGHFLLAFPLRNEKITRLIGLFPPHLVKNEKADIKDLIPYLREMDDFNIDKVHWFAEYKIHHRLAEQYQKGNVFLIGDAAHLHSPVGGQGMNAGIADAINLSWKLAHVIQYEASSPILETYEQERRTYAKNLVKTTDRGFKGIKWNQALVNRLREMITPYFIDFFINKSERLMENLFGRVSQLVLEYKKSPLNAGDSKLSGKRLPFYKNNTQLTDSLEWQVQVYGEIQPELASFLEEYTDLEVYVLEWEDKMADFGYQENGAYLIRPDGYIAWTSKTQDVSSLKQYLLEWF